MTARAIVNNQKMKYENNEWELEKESIGETAIHLMNKLNDYYGGKDLTFIPPTLYGVLCEWRNINKELEAKCQEGKTRIR